MNTLFMLLFMGQITVPETSEPYQPIVASVAAVMPEGATFDGGWKASDGVKFLQNDSSTIHVWAKPGKHNLSFSGFWLHLKQVTFTDGAGQEITITSYLGHGFINEEATFTVLGGTDPPSPQPPTPGGLSQIMFFLDSLSLDNLPTAQRELVTSLKVRKDLESLGHRFLLVLDDDEIKEGVPAKWIPWVKAVIGDPLPRVAFAPLAGGAVTDYPMPANYQELLTLLGGE